MTDKKSREGLETKESVHPWYGVPATGSAGVGIGIATWSDRGIPVDIGSTQEAQGVPRKTATHYEGRTDIASLEALVHYGDAFEKMVAAADPKLPEELLGHLTRRCIDHDDALLRDRLIHNPSLSTPDVHKIAAHWKASRVRLTEMDQLPRLVYEHPQCGPARLEEMFSLSLAQDLAKDPTLSVERREELEGATLRCASRHLAISEEQLDHLARSWSAAFRRFRKKKDAASGHPDETYQYLEGELYEAAARICTHPRGTAQIVRLILDEFPAADYGLIPEKLLRRWAKLGNRSHEADWLVLRSTSEEDMRKEDEEVLWSAVTTMPGSQRTAHDSHLLHKAVTVVMQRSATKSHEGFHRRALEVLKNTPDLLDRMTWNRENLRLYLGAADRDVREIGLRGVSKISPHSQGAETQAGPRIPR